MKSAFFILMNTDHRTNKCNNCNCLL